MFPLELPFFGPQNRRQGLNLPLSFMCFLWLLSVSARWLSKEEKKKINTGSPHPLETTPSLVKEEGFPPSEF